MEAADASALATVQWSGDPALRLDQLREAREILDELTRDAVWAARAAGLTWEEIAQRLGSGLPDGLMARSSRSRVAPPPSPTPGLSERWIALC